MRGDDSQGFAPVAGFLWQMQNQRLRNLHVTGWYRRKLAQQARGTEGCGQAGDIRGKGVLRAQFGLSEPLLAELPPTLLIRQECKRWKAEYCINELHDGSLISFGMGNVVLAGVRRDDDKRNAGTIGDRRAVRAAGANRRRHVVVRTFGVVPGDDDGAFGPVRARGDLINGFGDESFADLGVRVTLMVVITQKLLLHGRVWIGGLQVEYIPVTAFYKKHAALFRKRSCF